MMKMMKKRLILLSLLSGLVSAIEPASADIPPYGNSGPKPSSGPDYCLKITNLNKYNDYFFLIYKSRTRWRPDELNLVKQEPECSYFLDPKIDRQIQAINKNLLKSNEIKELLSREKYNVNRRTIKYEYKDKFISFNFDPPIITNDLFWSYTDQLKQITDYFEITAVKPDRLELRKVKILYTYHDGTSEEKFYQTQDKPPAPSRRSLSWLIIMPVTALAVIGIIFAFRKWGRSSQGSKL